MEPGIPYLFDTGHCGLAHLADFDGSFSDPLPDGPRSLLITQSLGTMTLPDLEPGTGKASGTSHHALGMMAELRVM